MITDTQTPFSLEDLRQNYERLQADLQIVQNELDQALNVWRSILTGEKQEFKKQLADQQQAWDRDDQQWQKDRLAYEQKIKELEAFFTKQLTATEQHAIRALNELDSAWQQTLTQQTQEIHQREEVQTTTQHQLQQQTAQLEAEIARLQTRLSDVELQKEDQQEQLTSQIAILETEITNWQTEKVSWQQSFSEQLQQHQQTKADAERERQQNETLVHSLQQDLVTLGARLRTSEQVRHDQQQHLETYVDYLEKQITSLNHFIQQVSPPPISKRRESDQPLGTPGTPLPSKPYAAS